MSATPIRHVASGAMLTLGAVLFGAPFAVVLLSPVLLACQRAL